MNYNELYVFNTVLDGKDIYAVQKFSDRSLTRAATEVIKDILVEKGYLDDYITITQKGVEEISKIKQYKESKKYVCILNMVIGFADNSKGILLTLDKKGEFNFSVIDINKNLDVLIELFPKLLQDNVNTHVRQIGEVYIAPKDLINEYKFDVKTSFTISTETLNLQSKATKELLFESDGKKYYYDCITNLLHESNCDELVNLLHNRLEVI